MMNWVSIRNKKGELIQSKIPNDDKLYLFIQWHKGWNTEIQNYIGTVKDVYAFRNYNLHKHYTHYCEFVKPK